MKRLVKLLVLSLCSVILLCGCNDPSSYSENIDLYITNGLSTITRANIELDSKYILKDYDKEYSEDGCKITIYYELVEG